MDKNEAEKLAKYRQDMLTKSPTARLFYFLDLPDSYLKSLNYNELSSLEGEIAKVDPQDKAFQGADFSSDVEEVHKSRLHDMLIHVKSIKESRSGSSVFPTPVKKSRV